MKTEQLHLRAVEPEDLDLLYNWENDPELMHYGTVHLPYSRHLMQQYIESANDDIYNARQFRWMIDLVKDNSTIGHIDLYDFEPADMRAAVAVAIDAQWQGHGFAQISLNRLLRFCEEQLLMHQVYAFVAAGNASSRALFEKCDFRCSGPLQDWKRLKDGYEDVWVCQKLFA